ncbi:large distal tail fiber subunit [Aeromonas phage AhSzw-1]|uniref:Large distal tail fiber subunit n=1 Tax=Aeromonas phage AhSzw-1 TaxID=2138299 RepID=A0A2R4AM90_9CAUD|nr:tail protein [Aeromonas phage AhSzw-1]AVR76154.1 large distal tail fiber subunit [Aeromonas phage AhSzw-1]
MNKSGDTMTGELNVPRLNATSGVIRSKANNAGGIHIGGGSTYSEIAPILPTGTDPVWSYALRYYGENDWRIGTGSRIYHQSFNPTANDVGALPISGGRLTGLFYAKQAVIAESPDGKNWVGLEAPTDTTKPYISVKIDGTASKVIDFNSPTESTFLTGVATQQNFTCTNGSAGGFYLNNVNDGSKYKWGVLKGTGNEFSIANWTDSGVWNKNVIEINKDATETTVNTSLTVKSNVFNLGYSDNANQHVWFRRANGTERSLMWSDEDYLRIRHKEGNWFGIKQNGSVHTSATPPSMNEGVYNGTTVGGVWRRGQGVYHAKVAHQGSSWAPAFSMYFHDTEGYDGYYTLGHLSNAGASPGVYCLHFMDGAGNQNKAWTFNGSSGEFNSPGNGNFNDVYIRSDRRMKSDLVRVEGAVDKVTKLQAYSYNKHKSITDSDVVSREVGLIAQDLRMVLPEAVKEAEDTTLTISNSAVNALLVEAIKELKDEIDQLRRLINGT